MAAEASFCGNVSRALSANARGALAEFRFTATRVAGHSHFCWRVFASSAVGARKYASVDSFNRRRSFTTDVSGTEKLRGNRNQYQRNLFRTDSRAHHGADSGDGQKFPRFAALPGPGEVVAAGIVGQATAHH